MSRQPAKKGAGCLDIFLVKAKGEGPSSKPCPAAGFPAPEAGARLGVWFQACFPQKGASALRWPFRHAVSIFAAVDRPSFSVACSRILYFKILPAAFIGNSATKSM